MKETIDEKTGEVTNELTKEERDEIAARSFGVFLNKVADGDLEVQASEELLMLTRCISAQARAQQGKVKGSLTVKINFTGDEKGALEVGYAIERKEPKPHRPRSIFWLNKQAQIVSQNPRQIELGLRDVSKKRELRDAAPRDQG